MIEKSRIVKENSYVYKRLRSLRVLRDKAGRTVLVHLLKTTS